MYPSLDQKKLTKVLGRTKHTFKNSRSYCTTYISYTQYLRNYDQFYNQIARLMPCDSKSSICILYIEHTTLKSN